jgi:hypothetical protein
MIVTELSVIKWGKTAGGTGRKVLPERPVNFCIIVPVTTQKHEPERKKPAPDRIYPYFIVKNIRF